MITIYYNRPKKEIVWIEVTHNGERHLSADIRPHLLDKESIDVCLSKRTLVDERTSKLIDDMKKHRIHTIYNISDSSIRSYENGHISTITLFNTLFKLLQK